MDTAIAGANPRSCVEFSTEESLLCVCCLETAPAFVRVSVYGRGPSVHARDGQGARHAGQAGPAQAAAAQGRAGGWDVLFVRALKVLRRPFLCGNSPPCSRVEMHHTERVLKVFWYLH